MMSLRFVGMFSHASLIKFFTIPTRIHKNICEKYFHFVKKIVAAI